MHISSDFKYFAENWIEFGMAEAKSVQKPPGPETAPFGETHVRIEDIVKRSCKRFDISMFL